MPGLKWFLGSMLFAVIGCAVGVTLSEPIGGVIAVVALAVAVGFRGRAAWKPGMAARFKHPDITKSVRRALRHGCSVLASMSLVASLTAGCGGSSASADRVRALQTLDREIGASAFGTGGLATCLAGDLRRQATPALEHMASPHQVGDASSRMLRRLVGNCVSQGHGANVARGMLVRETAGLFKASDPPAARDCVLEKLRGVPNSQLAVLIAAPAGSAAATVQQVRAKLVDRINQCIDDPAVLRTFRRPFLTLVRTSTTSMHWSMSFRACVLEKAGQLPAPQLKYLTLHPAAADAATKALVQHWANACLASGLRP